MLHFATDIIDKAGKRAEIRFKTLQAYSKV